MATRTLPFGTPDDVRKELARMIVNRGWGLLEMRTVDLSLEDVFVKLVTTENGG